MSTSCLRSDTGDPMMIGTPFEGIPMTKSLYLRYRQYLERMSQLQSHLMIRRKSLYLYYLFIYLFIV